MAVSSDIQKKEIIKAAARDLFFRFGFNKTSMEDIAHQSKLAKPSLYYYYPSKESIFNEIVIEEATLFMDKVERKIPQELPANEKIAYFFRTVYKDLNVYAKKMAETPEIIYEYSPHGRPIVNKINELFLEKLLPLLEAGQHEKILVNKDREVIANTLVLMTDFLNLEWISRYPEGIRDQIVETMIDIILNGLKRRK
jgi:AcrR family transcriptional regulator